MQEKFIPGHLPQRQRVALSVPFVLMAILFNVCLIASNLFETKIFTAGMLTLTGGVIIFPVSYILNDCIVEVWGFRKARLVIWSGFAMNFFVVAMAQIVRILPSASFWDGGEHFDYIFGLAPRVTMASLLAFLSGSTVNAYIMSKMKVASHGKRFSVRAVVSSVCGETVDSQEGVSYELGSNTMLDGLDEALDGLSAGEETTFEGTLEAGEHEGEKAQIKVKVNSVKAEELPELDDDFAQEASEFDTLDELKADIRKACERDAEGRQATEARDAFIAKLKEGLEIPVPKGVKAEAAEQHLKGMTPDPEQATKEQKAEAEEAAENELRDQMVLDALAEKMDVKVSQRDVTNFLASIAQQYGMDPSAFINAIIRNGQLGSAVEEVGRSKGLLAGMRAVTFKCEGEVLDLSSFLGDVAEDEEAESVEAASAAAAVADELAQAEDAE